MPIFRISGEPRQNQYLKNTPNEVTVYILLNKLIIKYMFRTLLTISLTIMLLSCIRSETKVNQKTNNLFSDIKQL